MATGQIEVGAVEGAEVVDEVGIEADEVEHLYHHITKRKSWSYCL